jgi:hypothetical protein
VYLATQCVVLASKVDMPDDGDALALTFAQSVAPAEVEEVDEEEGFGVYGSSGSSGWMRGHDSANLQRRCTRTQPSDNAPISSPTAPRLPPARFPCGAWR